jgi:hypothetical protein
MLTGFRLRKISLLRNKAITCIQNFMVSQKRKGVNRLLFTEEGKWQG